MTIELTDDYIRRNFDPLVRRAGFDEEVFAALCDYAERQKESAAKRPAKSTNRPEYTQPRLDAAS